MIGNHPFAAERGMEGFTGQINDIHCVFVTAPGAPQWRGKMKRIVPVWVTYVLILAAIGCMAFGIYRGEVDTVLHKAVNICMECIGLG